MKKETLIDSEYFSGSKKSNYLNEIVNSDWSKQEVEDIIEFVRLHLYNKGVAYGPKAIINYMVEIHPEVPIPSERTIARILSRRYLTHRRTGYYPEDYIV